MIQIQTQNKAYTTLYNVYKTREKWKSKQQLILSEMRVFLTPSPTSISPLRWSSIISSSNLGYIVFSFYTRDFKLNTFEDGVVSFEFMIGLLMTSPIFASLTER